MRIVRGPSWFSVSGSSQGSLALRGAARQQKGRHHYLTGISGNRLRGQSRINALDDLGHKVARNVSQRRHYHPGITRQDRLDGLFPGADYTVIERDNAVAVGQ